jgi:hypothetical protein
MIWLGLRTKMHFIVCRVFILNHLIPIINHFTFNHHYLRDHASQSLSKKEVTSNIDIKINENNTYTISFENYYMALVLQIHQHTCLGCHPPRHMRQKFRWCWWVETFEQGPQSAPEEFHHYCVDITAP